jgi:hypothetical protein
VEARRRGATRTETDARNDRVPAKRRPSASGAQRVSQGPLPGTVGWQTLDAPSPPASAPTEAGLTRKAALKRRGRANGASRRAVSGEAPALANAKTPRDGCRRRLTSRPASSYPRRLGPGIRPGSKTRAVGARRSGPPPRMLAGQQGSRCDAGAAPATVSGDEGEITTGSTLPGRFARGRSGSQETCCFEADRGLRGWSVRRLRSLLILKRAAFVSLPARLRRQAGRNVAARVPNEAR